MKIRWIFMVLLLCVMTGAGGLGWQLGYFSLPGEEVPVTVQRGENFVQLAVRLQAMGVVRSERALRWYVNLRPPAQSLKRGEFGLYKNMPVPEVVRALTEGRPLEYKLTVPEGFNIFQVAELLEARGFGESAAFLEAARAPELIEQIPTLGPGQPRPGSIEGYVFPDTYLLQKVFTPREIAQIMLSRFREVYQSLIQEIADNPIVRSLNLSPHEVVILASIIEKETGAGFERPLVAGVFVNRLRKRMRLQTDPTVIYGVWVEQGAWDGNIRRRDLNTPNAYNTYQIAGLPAGPIASPGLNALRAVLSPAETDYLFFVSKNDGTHIFSTNYRDHSRAVRETQLNPAAKEGKSWRDLPPDQRAR
jgi:UPF0755 protein